MKSVKLRSGRFGKLRPGYRWIFKRQILKSEPSIKPGDLVSVVRSDNSFAGVAYYNPHSDIVLRILSFKDEVLDREFFKQGLELAAAKRQRLNGLSDAYRVVFSDADALPGLVIDRYGDTVVFQSLTLGIERFKETIVDVIDEVLRPKYIYERSDTSYRKEEGLSPKTGWWGDEGDRFVEISEGECRFFVDIMQGHKTGFYLDQRRSRLAIKDFVKGKDLLDLCCYTGAFCIHAAKSGAASATGVDIKSDWLRLSEENARLNNVSENVEFVKGDAFDFVKNCYNSGRSFDIIIVDPPSFVKSRHSVGRAIKGYEELNLAAMRCLNSGGVLATFSCSHNMPNERFSGLLKDAASKANKKISILKRCHQDIDHPIVRAMPETEYLKGYFLKVEDK